MNKNTFQEAPSGALSTQGPAIPESPAFPGGLRLTDEAISQLADHWLPLVWKETGKRPRHPVERQLSEAQELAALVDELPKDRLLPSETASDLRSLCLVARSLHEASLSMRNDRDAVKEARRLRAVAHQRIRLVVDSLRLLHAATRDEAILPRVSQVDTRARSEGGRALTLVYCAVLVKLYEEELRPFGVTVELADEMRGLSQRLYELSGGRCLFHLDQLQATRSRDAVLGFLYRRVLKVRQTLRFVFREDPAVLARLRSRHARKKQGKQK